MEFWFKIKEGFFEEKWKFSSAKKVLEIMEVNKEKNSFRYACSAFLFKHKGVKYGFHFIERIYFVFFIKFRKGMKNTVRFFEKERGKTKVFEDKIFVSWLLRNL